MIEIVNRKSEFEEISSDLENNLGNNLDKNLNECAIRLDFSDSLIKYEHCMPIYVHSECLNLWYSNKYNQCVICNKKIVKDGQTIINKIEERITNTPENQGAKVAIFIIVAICATTVCSGTAVIIYELSIN